MDARLQQPARVDRVEVVLRGPQPRSLQLDGLDEGVQELGAMSAQHGPGRDEWTWVWDAPGPAPVLKAVRVRLKAKRLPPTVVEVRVFPAP